MNKIKLIYISAEEWLLVLFLRMAGRWAAIFNKGLQQEVRMYFLSHYPVNDISPERAEEIINEMILFRKSSVLSFIPYVISLFALLLSVLALALSVANALFK